MNNKEKDSNNPDKDLLKKYIACLTELEAVHEELDKKTRINDELSYEIASIYNSSSWKYTSWCRVIGHIVKSRSTIIQDARNSIAKSLNSSYLKPGSYARDSINELAQHRGSYLSKKLGQYNNKSKEKELPVIGVSIVTFNSIKWITSFIESLINQKYPCSKIDLYFTDNTSTDNTLHVLRSISAEYSDVFSSINIFKQPNFGFGSGHNNNVKNCQTEFAIITNVDLEFDESSIINTINYALSDDPEVASWEFRQKPFEHPKYYDPITLETSWSSHACVLIKTSKFNQVGGYERKIFMYGEDVELSYRFVRQGFKLKYLPFSVVNHFTYENEHQIKPQQLFGSTLANAYIRLRYGSFNDIKKIPALYLSLLFNECPVKNAKRVFIKNFITILINSPYFLKSRRKSGRSFPIRGWDYQIIREGTFYINKEIHHKVRPLISIITRTYAGREDWLIEAVTSVYNQTYNNIELIIVEDGSNSQEFLVHKFKPLFDNMGKKIIYSAQEKRGRSYNGNAGLKIANGEFLMFLDDDDLLYPDHVEVLLGELLSNKLLSGAYSLSYEVLTRKTSSDQNHYSEELHFTPDGIKQEFSREILLDHNYLPIQSVLFKRELFEKYGGFNVEMEQLEDWDLWTRFTTESNFKYIPKTTSLFRTPYDPDERKERFKLLHENYKYAKEIQKAHLIDL